MINILVKNFQIPVFQSLQLLRQRLFVSDRWQIDFFYFSSK